MHNKLTKDIEFVLGTNHHYSNLEKSKIKEAIELCKLSHKNQFRLSGEEYYTHPLEVAKILVELKMDSDTVITGILHDTLEDTELKIEKISESFGENVASLVNGVTKLTQISFKSENVQQAQNFRKLILAISEDIRVLIVKLVDRLHNMRTLGTLPHDKKIKIALETLEIYAPLAGRIGFQQIKLELQDIAFSILYVNVNKSITAKLDKLIGADSSYIDQIIKDLESLLNNNNIKAEIYGRKKSPYSIWMKMQQKNISFEQLCDVFAFRVILDDMMDCYKALGIIHTTYKMVPDNFQDFISLPKKNNYQSIHTVVIGPSQKKIEIQIRTKKMHEVAEFGLAAHWVYKESASIDNIRYEWVSDLLNIVDQDLDPEEFLHNTKLAMYYDQIFCFTPKGKIISLPKNATVLDFAYLVDVEVGNHSTGALVNSIFFSNEHILNNGDQVQIITSPKQKPSLHSINFVTTGKARSSIQKFIFYNNDARNVDIGKNIIESILNSQNIRNSENLLIDIVKNFNKVNLDLLYIDIALDIISERDILSYLRSKNINIQKLSKLIDDNILKRSIEESFFISVKALSKYLTIKIEKCCNPNKTDKIIGFLNRKILKIHSYTCELLNKDKFIESDSIPLSWEDEEPHFIIKIKCNSKNENIILSNIVEMFEKNKCHILDIKTKKIANSLFKINIEFKTSNIKQSDAIITFLQSIKGVETVSKMMI